MAANRSCYPESSIIRGGWVLEEACKYYWSLNKGHHITAAGRAIAGFHDTAMKVFAPKLSYLENKERNNGFMVWELIIGRRWD